MSPKTLMCESSPSTPSTSPDSATQIDQLLNQVRKILLETWSETGFGHLEIDSERIKQDKVAVILKGSTFYRYVICQEDVEQASDRKRE